MSYQVLIIAFVVSFLGSIPPGTINITTMQLAVQGHKRAALFFILASVLTEFVYAGVTVRFQLFLSEKPLLTENFQIITALAMLMLGVLNLMSKTSSRNFMKVDHIRGRKGFRQGVVLGLLNPLTIPFWLAVTAYIQSNGWIRLDGTYFWFYLTGIALGTLALLLAVRQVGARFTRIADNQFLVHKIPGVVFISLGVYNLIDWYF